MEFKKWPKIPRWESEAYIYSEKIDGTNACVIITEDGEIAAQSRKRLITPDDDNFGFASWVHENKEELLKLGPGYHYGEWWGKGIQRGYDQDEKIFSLFRYYDPCSPDELPTPVVRRVPIFYHESPIDALNYLVTNGSLAAPGYMKVEGVIAQSTLYEKVRYKLIWDK